MNYPARTIQSLQVSPLATEQTRQRLVSAIISFTNGTPFSLEPHQQHVLDRFTRGRLTIDEVVYYLEAAAKSR
ncbi:hypothetical protein E4631_18395 [Hymenobacter sp. UV11]|uniref:hypothetical protein n=1 Tax=Hymenobacter sp. UV11 TaxID=1849735 RepID=UPI00105E1AC3|nr:hypothetical protein [Hymenobacter sp. UV11]TFZ64952.1 hypothetical protein E4631_18395 [Hymenobacter sp. UV11]